MKIHIPMVYVLMILFDTMLISLSLISHRLNWVNFEYTHSPHRFSISFKATPLQKKKDFFSFE